MERWKSLIFSDNHAPGWMVDVGSVHTNYDAGLHYPEFSVMSFLAKYECHRAKPAILCKLHSKNRLLLCGPLRPCGIQNRMMYLLSFGESGKNFIEIGKRPKVQETMLSVAVP